MSPLASSLPQPSLAVLIRFANSATTLPSVLSALQRQTLQPDDILGINSGSQDGSATLLQAAGGRVIDWPHRYEHAKVLNFGLGHLSADLVLILSSHTVLESPESLAHMVQAMRDPSTACVSLKWDEDPYYSDRIDWQELRTKGLKFGSIYSNSMGMIRRRLWQQQPFDETLPTAEDYAWAIHQLRQGHTCQRLALPFHYQRQGHLRDREFADIVFRFAHHHRLNVAWLGARAALRELLSPRRTPATRERLFAYLRAQLRLS